MSGGRRERSESQSSKRPHSSFDREELYAGTLTSGGVAIQCQYCPGQSFRRSRVRMADLTQVFLMLYPVRCLRCSQRQWVSFTVAGISVPSHIRQRRAKHTLAESGWTAPVRQSLRPKPVNGVSTKETPDEVKAPQEKASS